MQEWLAGYGTWLRAFHIIAVIAWMAGMFYLPRLYVYHCDAAPGSQTSEMLKVMERRLLRVIINPAMIATFIFGILLLAAGKFFETMPAWLLIKIILVLVLAGLHGFLAKWRKEFANDANRHTARFYRVINEIPTVIMITVVILAVVKPS